MPDEPAKIPHAEAVNVGKRCVRKVLDMGNAQCQITTPILILIGALAIAGCATQLPTDPFAAVSPDSVKTILVGEQLGDPFSSCDATQVMFNTYFRIEDPETVRKLTSLMKTKKKTPSFPFIGVLSYQRFLDAHGCLLAETHIVNWKSAVVVAAPNVSEKGFYGQIDAEEFCRTVYELMVLKAPTVIVEQRKFYQESGQSLERLLFEGREVHEKAQPTTGASGVPAAQP